MANAYSHLHNFSDPVVDKGVDLAGKMLLHRQQKYDHNKLKLQSLADEFASLDMEREVDKEYANERLTKIRELTNQYIQGVDLADSSFTASIASNMSQFVDDNILNAVSSTRRMKNEDSVIAEAMKKSPDKFSETNQQWAYQNSDRERYKNSKDVGDVYGGGYKYVEYRDIQGKLSKHAPEIAKAIGAEYIVLGNGSGYFRSVNTYKKVDRAKLEAALDGLLDEKDKTQMAVNTWSTFGKLSDDQLKTTYETRATALLTNKDEEIGRYERYAQSINDPEAKEMALETVKELKEERMELERKSEYKVVEGNIGRKGIESMLYEQMLKAPYLNAYSKAPELIESKVYQLDVETRKHEIALAKLQLQAEKAASEKKEKEEKIQAANPVARQEVKGGDIVSLLEGIQKEEEEVNDIVVSTVLPQFLPANVQGLSANEAKRVTDLSKRKMNNFLSQVNIEDLQNPFIERDITVDGKKEKVRLNLVDNVNGKLVPNETSRAIGKYLVRRNIGSPIRKAVHEQFENSIGEMEKLLVEAVGIQSSGVSTDYDLRRLPSLKGGYRKDEKTGMFTYDENYPSNYYNLLERKAKGQSVSEAGELTLKANIISHMLADPEIAGDPALKRELENYYENEVLSKTDGKLMRGASFSLWGTAVNLMQGKFTPDYTVGSAPLVQAISPDYYLSAYTRGDFETNRGTLGNSPAEVLKDMKDGLARSTRAEDFKNVLSIKTLTLDKENAPEDRRILVGHIQNKFGQVVQKDTPITVTPEEVGGKLTGNYEVTYAYTKTPVAGLPGGKVTEVKVISKDDIEIMGLESFYQPEQPLLSADVKNPHVEKLGKLQLSAESDFHKRLEELKVYNKPENVEDFNKFAKSVYENYTVDLEPYNLTYAFRLKNEKDEVVQTTTLTKDIFEEEYISYLLNANEYKKLVILQYLQEPKTTSGEIIKF
jgi:hypothetical protein